MLPSALDPLLPLPLPPLPFTVNRPSGSRCWSSHPERQPRSAAQLAIPPHKLPLAGPGTLSPRSVRPEPVARARNCAPLAELWTRCIEPALHVPSPPLALATAHPTWTLWTSLDVSGASSPLLCTNRARCSRSQLRPFLDSYTTPLSSHKHSPA